ncbi:hypothetical protein AM588_10005261 [Phytophthora nicotianae]|uniref:Peptidase M24 domain-containing protein n=1 Tax=Phytophthora nicotianae TaxID=4792 RepID=A0A0W8DA77_PHYNI|nr:hypothetical protein AM588_10005261 [Phytophthora nicotianae]
MTLTDDTVKAVLEDRPSRLSDLKPTQSETAYSNLASPGKPGNIELENGALREGKPLQLLSKECIGLLAQYAGVGFLAGVIPGVIYPVLQGYLNAEGTIVVSATVLVQIPWCYKMFFGVISDCFPIMGYRRRPYMVLGWVFCVVILFIMAVMSVPDPYYGDSAMHNIDEEDWTAEQIASINESASSSAGKYVVPMMLASFGYLLCEVAADAMVVEYAQREPIEQRGRVQTAVYAVKTSFTAVGAAVIAFFMNGEEYAGCEVGGGYASDITRTWPVGGKLSSGQEMMYEFVLDVQKKCLEHLRTMIENKEPITLNELHDYSVDIMMKRMLELGILKNKSGPFSRSAIREFQKYNPTHIGHYLGMDTHDTPHVTRSAPLVPGMVVTVEPGIYLPKNDFDLPEEFRGIGIRIEDDVVITDSGIEITTTKVPKELDAMEALRYE